MAKRRVTGRGRKVAALLLLGFVLVSTVVIWRRSAGIERARVLRELERARVELLAEKARLERDIRDASSRARLVPLAERRLGMHVPHDSEIVHLERPRDGRASRTADAP